MSRGASWSSLSRGRGLGASHVQRDGLTAEGHGSRREDGGSRRPLAHAGPPFGSEMGWSSTGQEEIYGGTKYFGGSDTAQVGLNAILGYMPKAPHRDHDGCARRHWDCLYGAPKTERLEWMIRHYGSSLDAIREYRRPSHRALSFENRLWPSGKFEAVTLDAQTHAEQVMLAPADNYTPSARLRADRLPRFPASAAMPSAAHSR